MRTLTDQLCLLTMAVTAEFRISMNRRFGGEFRDAVEPIVAVLPERFWDREVPHDDKDDPDRQQHKHGSNDVFAVFHIRSE